MATRALGKGRKAGLIIVWFLMPALLACGTARERAEIEFLYYRVSQLAPDLSGLVVTLRSPDGTRTLTAADFSTERYATPHTRPLEARSTGSWDVVVELRANATVVATATLQQPIRLSRRLGVGIHAGGSNPSSECLGCEGVRAFPMAGAGPNDSLFISWGSSIIGGGAIP